MAEESKKDLSALSDSEFELWLDQHGYQAGTDTYKLLASMRTAMINLSRTAQEAVINASAAVKTAEKARDDAQKAKPMPVLTTSNSPGMMEGVLPTPRRLTVLNPGVKKNHQE